MEHDGAKNDMSGLSTEALISQLDSGNNLRIVGAAPNHNKNQGGAHVVAKRLLTKNARRSRKPLGKNRGEPKKGGAGSKTVWGKAGCELYGTSAALDESDPNYDSEAQDDSFIDEPRVVLEEDFQRELKSILNEYFETGDVNEVAEELRELENTRDYENYIHGIVSSALMMALEHRPAHRELVSALLADTCAAGIVAPELVSVGFTAILRDLNELVVDIPDAVECIGRFMARAVADNCLPESFVKKLLEEENNEVVRDAAKVARGLLSDRRNVFRLDGIWVSNSRPCSESVSESETPRCVETTNDTSGTSPRSRFRYDSGSGAAYCPRPVLLLIHELQVNLREYLASGDCNEFVTQLKAMDVPHFHHELIYELVTMLIDENRDAVLDAFLKLVAELVSEGVVTQRQIAQAYRRIDADCDEILIDSPLASHWLEKFAQRSIEMGIHKKEIFDSLPLKGRKRFCSEGDGGQLKN